MIWQNSFKQFKLTSLFSISKSNSLIRCFRIKHHLHSHSLEKQGRKRKFVCKRSTHFLSILILSQIYLMNDFQGGYHSINLRKNLQLIDWGALLLNLGYEHYRTETNCMAFRGSKIERLNQTNLQAIQSFLIAIPRLLLD